MFMLDFDKDFFSFTRPIKDMVPYQILNDEEKAIIVHNAIGIDPENISIEVENNRGISYIKLQGEQKNELSGKIYSFNSRFQINENNLKEIEWHLENGLLYVYIYKVSPEIKQIPIKQQKLISE